MGRRSCGVEAVVTQRGRERERAEKIREAEKENKDAN